VKHLGTTKGKRKPLFISSFAQQLDLVRSKV